MKRVRLELQGAHLVIRDLLARLVARGVQQRFDGESTPGRRAANEIDDLALAPEQRSILIW